jgi:hypothetical protein
MRARLAALAALAALSAARAAGCAGNPRLSLPGAARHADAAAIVHVLGGDLSAATRQALAGAGRRQAAALRTGLVLGAPEFQRR